MNRKSANRLLLALGVAAISASLAACGDLNWSTVTPSWTPGQTATTTTTTTAENTPPPMVQDCGIVGISSPTKYVCNGKVYTSYQLAKLRADYEKKYAAGK